jgi:hypothetical protein
MSDLDYIKSCFPFDFKKSGIIKEKKITNLELAY